VTTMSTRCQSTSDPREVTWYKKKERYTHQNEI
jgi:hypothetical protein